METEVIDLSELMTEETIDLEMDATTKEEVISQLVDLLVQKGMVESKAQFIQDVYEREQGGATGIGNGIAIPHGKSDSVRQTAIAIGRTKTAVAWETLDDEPISTFILFAVSDKDKNNLHLKLLAKIAGSLANDYVCDTVKHANSPKKVIETLQEGSQ
ncbi:PTS system 2-O-alpha-mannosyl-D-glycerate-specific EIIABC component [Paraliobacillus ryukyuensis]|uniref:PTS system fructose-specific IIA component n=1 Tax=Paraliobacillus ryukyuensis TaxID=200904 RepID=A0A366EFW3_9BACI|nr:PTS sugar transporter subunit IIA [Paraliobacillus ryukyuensis]RBP00630.1 PTS system fructose-specific IIA component [Paraliobacillus ryukyuensis]